MDKKIILYIAALAILVSACNKDRFDTVPSPQKECLKVAVPLEGDTKDGIGGIFFPDAPSSGAIMFDSGSMSVMSVPVNEDGTLDWTLYISDLPRSAYSTKTSAFSRVMYCETGKTTEEWFARDKGYGCVFFAAIYSGNMEYRAGSVSYYQIVIPEEGYIYPQQELIKSESIFLFPDDGFDATGNAKNILVEGGKYYMATYLSHNYGNYPQTDGDWEEYGTIDSATSDHVVGAHSEVMQFDDIANSKFLNFSAFAPAGVMLRFNLAVSEGTLSMYRLEISLENTGNNMGGQAYMDFSDYANNKYSLVSAQRLSSITGTNLVSTEYVNQKFLQDDGVTYADTYTARWEDEYGNPQERVFGPNIVSVNRTTNNMNRGDWYVYNPSEERYEYRSPLILTTTPTPNYFYTGLLPQVEGISADSRIVFKAYDERGNCISVVRKKLPEGGFQGGMRYDFTLTFPVVGMEAESDWSGAGVYYQGGQLTEE